MHEVGLFLWQKINVLLGMIIKLDSMLFFKFGRNHSGTFFEGTIKC